MTDETSESSEYTAPVIAIDGLAASGKGTVASEVAKVLGWNLLDSGLLYRITAFLVRELSIQVNDVSAIRALLGHRVKILYRNEGISATQQDWVRESMDRDDQVFVLRDSQRQSYVRWNGEDITTRVRSDVISRIAAQVAASRGVREMLVPIQQARRIAPGLVADGRDMGTVIFPDSELKIFLEASLEMRARRRLQQLNLPDSDYGRIRSLMDARDKTDSLREVAPAKPADDAVRMDSSNMTISETVRYVLKLACERKLIRQNPEHI